MRRRFSARPRGTLAWTDNEVEGDPLIEVLERAERCFYDSLFANPLDHSALNGLGNILFFERDLDAAEFFIRRALYLAKQSGADYPQAEADVRLVLSYKKRPPVAS